MTTKSIRLHKISEPKSKLSTTYKYEEEIKLLNELYLDISKNKIIYSRIKQKLLGYDRQDKLKNKNDPDKLISLDLLIEKLVISKLKCHYCKCNLNITSNIKRDKQQWTLDRIDNNIPHTKENVVICCLKCNLERRRLDSEKFKFTKQLRIQKTD